MQSLISTLPARLEFWKELDPVLSTVVRDRKKSTITTGFSKVQIQAWLEKSGNNSNLAEQANQISMKIRTTANPNCNKIR